MRGLRLALAFLTTLPLPAPAGWRAEDLGKAAPWFPWVGLLIGGGLWAASLALDVLFSDLLRSALVVGLWVVLTGGLHLDGFVDSCDGLLTSAPRERRLEILEDARVGAFGVLGAVLLLALKIAAATESSAAGLVLAPVLGRWSFVPLAAWPSARDTGLGAGLRAGLGRRQVLLAVVLPLAAAAVNGWRGWVAFGAVHLLLLGLGRLSLARLGGITGDVLGAGCELVELIVLLTFSASPA